MWVSTQRRYFNKKTWVPGRGMRPDRKAKLDSIGFEWNRAHARKGPRESAKRRTEEIVERVVGDANKRAKLQQQEQQEQGSGVEDAAAAAAIHVAANEHHVEEASGVAAHNVPEEGVNVEALVEAAVRDGVVDETDVAAVVQQEVENVVAAVQQEAVEAAAAAAPQPDGPVEAV